MTNEQIEKIEANAKQQIAKMTEEEKSDMLMNLHVLLNPEVMKKHIELMHKMLSEGIRF